MEQAERIMLDFVMRKNIPYRIIGLPPFERIDVRLNITILFPEVAVNAPEISRSERRVSDP